MFWPAKRGGGVAAGLKKIWSAAPSGSMSSWTQAPIVASALLSFRCTQKRIDPCPNRSGIVSGPALPTPLSRPATDNPSLLRSHALHRCFALLASRRPPYFDRTPRFDSNAPREPPHTFLTFCSRFALCTGVYLVLPAALFRCGCCLILTGGAHWASMAARSPGCACPHAQNGKYFSITIQPRPARTLHFPNPPAHADML